MPPVWLEELEQLQDRIPPFPSDEAMQVCILGALGGGGGGGPRPLKLGLQAAPVEPAAARRP
jgi:hypothetical protein